MKELDIVRGQLAAGRFDFTRHAFRRAVERNISDKEIRAAGGGAEQIESYPDDKYGPSAHLLGFADSRPLHIQVSLLEGESVRIITIYEPDPAEWLDYRVRR